MPATSTRRLGGFTVEREEQIPTLGAVVLELVHERTGARVLAFQVDDEENALLAAVPTSVFDETGWSHVLEHCVLHSRSRHHDHSSARRGRLWLARGGGAWTSPDFTHYRMAAADPVAFEELIALRVDQLFEPQLDDEVFRAEIRTELESPDDPASTLVNRGRIYNEQKSIAGLALVRAWDALLAALFPGSHYAVASGGDFRHMPDLTPQRLREHHARDYHPARARFITWGPAPVERIAAAFDAALARVPLRPPVAEEPPPLVTLPEPVTAGLRLASSPGDDLEGARQVLVGWATVDWSDPYGVFLHDLLCEALLADPQSPLLAALGDRTLGTGPAETLYHHGWRPRRHIFATGVKGTTDAGAVMTAVLEVLRRLADGGVPSELVDRALRRLELARRLGAPGASSTMLLLRSVWPAWLFGADPLAALRFDELAARFAADTRPLENFIRRRLLENPERATVVVEPDPAGLQSMLDVERERLADRAAKLTPDEREELRRLARVQVAREEETRAEARSAPAPSTAGLDCSVPEPPLVAAAQEPVGFEARLVAARGVTHVDAFVDLGGLSGDLVAYLPVYCALLERAARVPGGLAVELDVLVDGTHDRWSPRLRLGASVLPSERPAAVEALAALVDGLSFEAAEVAEVLAATGARLQESTFIRARENVEGMAAALVRDSAAFTDRVEGYPAVDFVQRLAASPAGTAEAAEGVAGIAGHVRGAAVEISAAVSDREEGEELLALTRRAFAPRAALPVVLADVVPGTRRAASRPWAQVGAFNAQVYRVPGLAHPQAGALSVALLAAGAGHVMPEVVTRGTAYHAYVQPDLDRGLAIFWSIRDPNIRATHQVFAESVRRLVAGDIDAEVVHGATVTAWLMSEAGLGPALRARRAWRDARRGVTTADRVRARESALAATADDIASAARLLLDPGRATLGPAERLGELDEPALEGTAPA